MEDEDRPLLRRQPAEPTLEFIPVCEQARRVRVERGVRFDESDMAAGPADAPCLGVAGTDDQAVQPGLEAGRLA